MIDDRAECYIITVMRRCLIPRGCGSVKTNCCKEQIIDTIGMLGLRAKKTTMGP